MRISQVFAQGGSYGCGGYGCCGGCGCDYGCYDWECDGRFRRTGYFYRNYGNGYYSYNDGCGFQGHPRGFLDIFR